MSHVTTATILVSWAEGVSEDMITSHNFRPPGRAPQSFRKMGEDQDEWPGGSKYMECDLYAAGFNYVPGAVVEEWFKSLPWASGDAAFLVWEENGEQRGSASVGWVDW